MASGSVSFRLSEEMLTRLCERAKAENKKVSDLAREILEAGLKPGVNADNSAILERIERLEGTIRALLGVEEASVMTRIDSVNADFWQANEMLLAFLTKGVMIGAEARYFARLAAMYGMDVAHYVAQKTEIGIVPKPPDKDEKNKQMAFYEKKCKEYAKQVLGEGAQKEPS
jgi:predicted DNA-binding protein